MNRNVMQKMVLWKEEGCKKPLLLYGTKGTGKTYLSIEFAKTHFSQYLYLNFELNLEARDAFCTAISSGTRPDAAVAGYFQINPVYLPEILVIFDEISFCPPLLKALGHKQAFPAIAVSGLFPEEESAARFTALCVSPLGFDEFLTAVGNEWYVDIIKGHFATEQPVPDIVHQELLALFEEYLVVGGMPAAVNEYISSGSSENVGEVLFGLRNRMERSLREIWEESDAARALQVFQVIPEQLARENKKFRFNSIRKGVTYAMYQDGIYALEKSGLILRLNQMGKPNHFKLYFSDVGMLSVAFAGKMNDEIRKALLENYVMQTLCRSKGFQLYFWESEARARVEFLMKSSEEETPVELRISSNSKRKSIGVFLEGKPRRFLRIGFENYYSTDVMRNVPLYAIFCLV